MKSTVNKTSGSNSNNEKLEFNKKRDMEAILSKKEFKMLKNFKKSVNKHKKG